ncbi:MAG: isochorismate synthase [Actinomycetota bacterium]
MSGDRSGGASPLGPAFDLLAAYEPRGGCFFEREGLGVSASLGPGAIEIGPVPHLRALARATLAVLRGSPMSGPMSGPMAGRGAPPPVAMGALPFDARPASLLVPDRAVRRTDGGETWLLDRPGVAESDVPSFRPERVTGDLPHEAFRPVQLTEEPTQAGYGRAVTVAVERIAGSELEKVVLARTLAVDAGRTLDARRLLHRLRAVEPHCFTFAAPVDDGILVGASPELLLSRRGSVVRSMPLAGTAPRAGDPDEDRANAEALAASSKDREEHAIVVESVAEALGACCDDLRWDREPVLEPTANVWHLATRFEGRLRDPAVTALDLVAELHPTPAVCGTPRSAARATIAELERFDRGSYAGPVGWMDAAGDGEWAIALRCARLDGERATLFAGAGIVAASEPSAEIDETDRKFRAFLDSLRWG